MKFVASVAMRLFCSCGSSILGGQLVSEKKMPVDGAPGRELVLVNKDTPVTTRVRIAMVEGRRYTLQAITFGPLYATPDPDADRFFDSFRLTKK